jgi:hypothetical protein
MDDKYKRSSFDLTEKSNASLDKDSLELIPEEVSINEEDTTFGKKALGFIVLSLSILGGSSIGVFSNFLPI